MYVSSCEHMYAVLTTNNCSNDKFIRQMSRLVKLKVPTSFDGRVRESKTEIRKKQTADARRTRVNCR